jgi:Fur family ferric uptake transcriptional regulator
MNTGKKYKTKQRQTILNCMQESQAEYMQIKDILQQLESKDMHIGAATAYRNLNELVQAGMVRKINVEGIPGACYQYIREKHTEGFCLKCEKCNRIMDTECDHIYELYSHIMSEHEFSIDPDKTVFYGFCEKCRKESI